MFRTMRAKARHQRLMAVAVQVVRDAERRRTGREPLEVSAELVAVLAFGRQQLRIRQEEAAEYLAAAMVARGHSIEHLSKVGVDVL